MNWFRKWLNRRTPNRGALRRQPFRPRLEALEERQVPTVNYYGGNVLPHVEAQALYLGSQWSVSPNSALTSTVDGFLKDIVGGAYMTALTNAGYGVGTGTASPGYIDGTVLANNSVITDAYIQNAIVKDLGNLQPLDANRLYIVYVEPNVAVNLGGRQGTTQQGILGYHGAFAGPGGATIRYAVIAYPGGTVRNSSLGTSSQDQLTAVTSHELAEAVTDPDVNYAQLGWYDPRRGEIGDITENNPSAQVRLDGYLVQEVADKNDQLLAINPPAPPPTQPPVTPPVTPPITPPVTPPATTVATTTTLTSAPVVYIGRHHTPMVTLTITITPASGSVLPDGTIELLYNGSVLGTATIRIVNGVAMAQFNVLFYGHGSFQFSAQYTGSASFQASTSNAVTVAV